MRIGLVFDSSVGLGHYNGVAATNGHVCFPQVLQRSLVASISISVIVRVRPALLHAPRMLA